MTFTNNVYCKRENQRSKRQISLFLITVYWKAFVSSDMRAFLICSLMELDRKEKSMFIDFVNANSEVNGITAYESFEEGFRLAVQMMKEVFGE